VTAAILGGGKTRGIADLAAQYEGAKAASGWTRKRVLAVTAPKNAGPESALSIPLASAFGIVPSMPAGRLKTWLVGELVRCEVELLIVDDAHDISTTHLALLKELTDRLDLDHGRKVGLCLVCASAKGEVPLQSQLQQSGFFWEQLRRRLAIETRYSFVPNHTADEVREICAGYQAIYLPQFPDLDLIRWSTAIFTYLTHPLVDTHGTGRVTMDNFVKLVNLALATAHARGLTNLDDRSLHAAAEVQTLKGDAVAVLDGEPSSWSDVPVVLE